MSAYLRQLIEVLTNDQHLLAGVVGDDLIDQTILLGCAGGKPILVFRLRHRVDHSIRLRHIDADFDAIGWSDVALGLDLTPRCVVALRADQGEDIRLTAVLTNERGCESETTSTLNVRRESKNGSGQQVDLVVDDQPPITGVEDLEVRVDPFPLDGQYLIRRNRHGADFLLGSGVLTYLVRRELGTTKEFVPPLSGCNGVRHQNQGRCLGQRHGESTHDGLAGPARQHHHSRSAVPESVGCLDLIVAWLPFGRVQCDGVTLAVDVSRDVFGRPPEFDEGLF